MARLAHVMRLLGNDAERARILFVTLDPQRDTPQALHRYVTQFDPEHAVGLTGTIADIERLTKQYRAAYRPRSKIEEAGISSMAMRCIFLTLKVKRACWLLPPIQTKTWRKIAPIIEDFL